MASKNPPDIGRDDVYFLTYLGTQALAEAGTSLSRSELALLVLIDGRATVGQVQVSAGHIPPGEVLELLDKLARSDHIALKALDLGDFFTDSAPEPRAKVPSDKAIANGVASLQQKGYIVRIARRPKIERKLERGEKFSVLVVEDDLPLAKLMSAALTQSGFVARIASNREQIVAALRQPPAPDLVLLDVVLQDADGFEILSRMRKHPTLRNATVVMVTGRATREAVLSGLKRGANGYVTKPFEVPVLVKAVNTVLGIEGGDQGAAGQHLWDDEAGRN